MIDDDPVSKLYLGNSNDPNDILKKQIVEKALSESLQLRKLSKRLDDIFFEKSGQPSTSQSSHSGEEEDASAHSESSSGAGSNLSEQEIDFLLQNIVQQEEQESHNDNEEAQEDNIEEEDQNEEDDHELVLVLGHDEEESFAEEEEETNSTQESGRVEHNSVNLEAFFSIMEFFSNLLPSAQDSIPFARDSQANYQLLHLFSILTEVQKKSMTTDQAIKYVYDLMEKIKGENQQNPN